MIYGLGMIESGITFDYGQLVLDAEFARMIKHTVRGIAVDDRTIAVDAIKEIGPGGNFLMHETTFEGMRGQSDPVLLDRKTRSVWQEAGSPSAYDRAMEKVRWILENHEPEPLAPEVLAGIRAIVAETEEELGIGAGTPVQEKKGKPDE